MWRENVKKRISIANFNAVFVSGQEEKPLLEYFDTIFMPALTERRIRVSGDSSYRIMNILVQEKYNEYILSGIIVKKTILEIKSDLDEEGNLIEKDEKIPTAPYSTFVIYLKNHRMIYAENQKGSPDLRSFRATVQYILNEYIRDKHEEVKELPIPIIHVTGIPSRQKLRETLKEAEKVKKLTLRFYPLNGDLEFPDVLDGIVTDLRKMVGSKNGEIVLKSPKNIPGIIDVVEKSEGTVEAIFNVQYPGKRDVTINNEIISERMEIDVESDTLQEEVNQIIDKGKDIDSLKYVSQGNKEVYEANQAKIIPFYRH